MLRYGLKTHQWPITFSCTLWSVLNKRTYIPEWKNSSLLYFCWWKGLSTIKFCTLTQQRRLESTQIVHNWILSHTLILFTTTFFPSCFMSFSLEALPTLNQLIMLPWMHYSEFLVNSLTTLLYTRVASDSNDDVQTVQQLKFEWAELHTWCMILFNSFFFSQLTRTGTHVVACRW